MAYFRIYVNSYRDYVDILYGLVALCKSDRIGRFEGLPATFDSFDIDKVRSKCDSLCGVVVGDEAW